MEKEGTSYVQGGHVELTSNILFSPCSVVLFVNEADVFLRKRSKVP